MNSSAFFQDVKSAEFNAGKLRKKAFDEKLSKAFSFNAKLYLAY